MPTKTHNVKYVWFAALAVALLCLTGPAGAVAQFSMTFVTTGDAATVRVSGSQNVAIRTSTLSLPAHSRKVYALEYWEKGYDFIVTACNKTYHQHWSAGRGVTVTITGCTAPKYEADR